MPIQTTNAGLSPGEAFVNIRSRAASAKQQAQSILTILQSGQGNSSNILNLANAAYQYSTSISAWSQITGLDSQATSQGYPGSLLADCGPSVTAAQAITSWIANNFPVDAGGYLMGWTLNPTTGETISRTFTSAQTAGLQTTLTNFIATIN
jgi:hypothetical protein